MDSSELLTSDIGNQLPDISSSISDALAPLLLLSTVISVIFIAAYIYSILRRWKVEKAILSMQKDIREMNERDRARAAVETPSVPMPTTPTVSEPPLPEPPTDNLPGAE